MVNPYEITEPTCISFSGGRTSAYMLYQVLQAHGGKMPDNGIVCFANTGKEEEATLKFVNDCSVNWGVKIHWIEYQDHEDPTLRYKEVTYETASRHGEPFESVIRKRKYLPNPVTRFCTSELKVRTMACFLKHSGLFDDCSKSELENTSWIGLRYDEERRAAKIKDKSRIPLFTAKVSVQDISNFWAVQSFNLELPTYKGRTLAGNCDLCFLKPMNQVATLIAEKPERAIWWAKMEKEIQELHQNYDSRGAVFRFDRASYASMLQFSKDQISLIDPDEEGIACFCGD
jgi:3'-phosphoadenosine 5'-phosphosulfate sulfotransferase (PAPS reductase)/FAD synthetase